MRKTWSFVLSFLFLLPAYSSSRVIRDNRIRDLGVSPALGRGYSIATNTYQSTCLGGYETTKPSYDLKYRYIEIEQNWENEFTTSINSKNTFNYLFLKSNVNVFTEVSGNTTYHYHYIFANIDVDSYYHSINEATASMSDSAQALIERGDVTGFFDSCGPYYIRSIGRHSTFMALLRYRTTSSTRDVNFELQLKAKMRGFFGAGGSTDTTISTEFKTETEEKRLSINIWAYGLGKDGLADLIPTDIDSFKDSIQSAIKTMQDPDAGRVTSMEVVPWVENTQFQQLLELNTDDNGRRLFQKKKFLEANSELLSELDRIDRAQIDQYYKALSCKRILNEEYLALSGDYAYDPDNTYFSDLTAPGAISKEITLATFSDILSDSSVEDYWIANNQFNYGGDAPSDNPTSGAIACMNALNDAGLDNVHFRTITACVDARAISVPIAPILDNYCMPELSRVEQQ